MPVNQGFQDLETWKLIRFAGFLYELWNIYCNTDMARLLKGKDLQGDSTRILKRYGPGVGNGIGKTLNHFKTRLLGGFYPGKSGLWVRALTKFLVGPPPGG